MQNTDCRRVDLDWVRIVAFGLLILYHVGMYYVPWYWHVKSDELVPGLVPVMLATAPWRLALLFLVSGAATHFMLLRRSAGELARDRSTRLLRPLLFGVLVIVPLQPYYEVVQKLGYSEGFWAFYGRYLLADQSFCPQSACIILPTWNHLWFLPYLFVYTALVLILHARWPQLLAKMGERLESAFSGAGVLIWPFLFLATARILLAPLFPRTMALADDWYNHAQYFAVFLFGIVFARSTPVWQAMSRYHFVAAVLMIVSYVFIARLVSFSFIGNLPVAYDVMYALNQWSAMVAILGFAHLFVVRDGPVRRYLTDAIFPFYMVHQTALIAFAMLLKPYRLPVAVEASLLVAATALACVATYEVVRRVSWMRTVFGLRASPRRHAGLTPH